MNPNVREIPSTVKQGDEVEIQFAPFGKFAGTLHYQDEKGEMKKRPVTQHLDAQAFNRIVTAFKPEVLVDREHQSEHGGDSAAFGWVKSMRVDPKHGLMGVVNFTSIGADAVAGRVFRFPSASFDIEEIDRDNVRPVALTSVALTNRNNLPVRCVLNRAEAPAQPTVEDKELKTMEELAKLLGVANDPAALTAAVTELLSKVKAAEDQVLNAEADKFVEANKDKVCNTADLKTAYLANPAMAKAFVANVKVQAAAPAPRVTNSAEAKTPATFTAGQPGDVLATYNSLTGVEKRKYLRANSEAIHAARVAAEKQ